MKIYSSYRKSLTKDAPMWERLLEAVGRQLRRAVRRRRSSFNAVKSIKIGILSLIIALCGLALFNVDRFSFAYNPPLSEGLMVRPGVLSSFHSVPLTDPDEYEPDSMDRIEEVVEELKSEAASFTRKELKYVKYRIRPGDSVWDIARENGIRSGTLLWANTATIEDPSRLPIGKEILIPNMDAIEIKLRSGETIGSLAKRFAVSPGEIIKFNVLPAAKKLAAGDKIYVPNPNLAIQAVRRMAANKPSEGFMWPSSFRAVNSSFGFRMHPIRHRRIFHEGIDIGGGRGSTVYAAADGSISFVGWMRGYGKIIVIRHKDGITTRYAHLSNTRVFRGQRVEQGQLIGNVGMTGLATGPNLHFEVRKNGLPQNPMTYLRKR